MKIGAWFDLDTNRHPNALVILAAFMNGWDGKDPEEPDVDIIGLAIRELFEDEDLTAEEHDRLAFRYPMVAEAWLNVQVHQFGHMFGWLDGTFYLQTDEWWEENGGLDEMWLP